MQDMTPSELKKEIEQGKAIFLKIWKKGCGPCKLSESATDRLEKAHADDPISFVKVSASDYPEMYEITGSEVLPAFFVFKDKQIVGKTIGFKGLNSLKPLVSDALA